MSTGLLRLRMAIVTLNKLQCMPENMSQLLSNKTHMPKNLYQMSSENSYREVPPPEKNNLLCYCVTSFQQAPIVPYQFHFISNHTWIRPISFQITPGSDHITSALLLH